MIHYYVSEENTLQEIETPRAGCWISLIKPSEQEIAQVKNAYPIEENFLHAALD